MTEVKWRRLSLKEKRELYEDAFSDVYDSGWI
jgi:hypothetical protein